MMLLKNTPFYMSKRSRSIQFVVSTIDLTLRLHIQVSTLTKAVCWDACHFDRIKGKVLRLWPVTL